MPLACQHHQNATLSQRQAVAVSQTLSAMTALELELLAFIWQLAIYHHLTVVKWDECCSLSEYFICFSLTWWTCIITAILLHSLSSLILLSFFPLFCYLSYCPSPFLCKFFLSQPLPAACAWRLCAFPPGYQGQHGWRGTSGFVKN